MTKGMPKVALLVETSLGYGRALLRGVMRYARLNGPWAFYLHPGDLHQLLPKMKEWGGTGIIARIETPEIAKAVLAARLPTIVLDLNLEQLSPNNPLSRLSEICPDSLKAGRSAAEHLLERGFRSFAFVGVCGKLPWSIQRGEGFAKRLHEAGFECNHFPVPKAVRDQRWGREQAILATWMQKLPRPVGVLACDDDRGRQVLEACQAAGLHVPEDAAVVGVDNDELFCELSDPTLSSVALDTERAGYDAAALLDDLMSGRVKEPRRILVDPIRVVTRRSTDTHATEDRNLALAVRFIQENVAHPIGVNDVAEHLDCSRRTLEMRFQQILGRSINGEIQQIRIERAKYLLAETDFSMIKIAETVGFGSSNYMIRLFRRMVGQTPVEYRNQVQRFSKSKNH
jgi:LacI family transcriptional regulator